MKKQLLYVSMASMLLAMSACENEGKTEFLDDYSTTMYFTNSGVQEVGCLKIGELTDYTVYVYKAGSDHSATSSATATLLMEEELQDYNQQNNTHYKILPEECYEAQKKIDLSFGASELIHAFPVKFDVEEIDALDETIEYVLPYRLTSSKTVNKEKDIVLIKPLPLIPTVGFKNQDFEVLTVSPSEPEQTIIEKVVSVPFQNRWDFDCTVTLDEAAMNKYNEENNTDYKLLPEREYTYDKLISFKKGINEVAVKIIINRTEDLDFGNYMIPLKLVSCTNSHIQIEPTFADCLAGYCYALPNLSLSLDMLSSNAMQAGDGTGLLGLMDGVGNGKHFHSVYKAPGVVDDTYRHYIDIHLKTPIQRMMFEYWTRYAKGNGAPQRIVLWTSNDGKAWTQWQVVDEKLPSTGSTKYKSLFFKSNQPFSYLRFSVTKSPGGEVGCTENPIGSFNLDDLLIYGQ